MTPSFNRNTLGVSGGSRIGTLVHFKVMGIQGGYRPFNWLACADSECPYEIDVIVKKVYTLRVGGRSRIGS